MTTMMSTSSYNLINATSPSAVVPTDLASFHLQTAPNTDLWRKPATASTPPVESNNAPSLVTAVPIQSFKSAQVTVNAQWTRLYDQGGIVLYFTNKRAWVKTGIEYYSNRANLSTVGTPAQATSDWSLVPLAAGATSVTLRVEREVKDGELGPSIWVYMIGSDGAKHPVREITWAFHPDEVAAGGDLHVGVYVARPTGKDTEELDVHFTDFELN